MACHSCGKVRQTEARAAAEADQRAAMALQIASTTGVDGALATKGAGSTFSVPRGPKATERLAVAGQMSFLALDPFRSVSEVLLHYREKGCFPPSMTVVVTGDVKQKTSEGETRSSDRNLPMKGSGAFVLSQDGNVQLPALFKAASKDAMPLKAKDPVLVSVQRDRFERVFVYLWPIHIRLVNATADVSISEVVPESLQPAQHEVFAFLWDPGSDEAESPKSRFVYTVRTCMYHELKSHCS